MLNVQNITSKLASMPDAALKQYAEMHRDDPYTFSLAVSESNRRKQLRAQVPQQAPQPKVVDQELESMKALPEEQGIARLPIDMNMAGGGIVAFNDGGMAHFARGGDAGSDPKLAYRQYALTQARKLDLDPALVDSIFQTESGYDPEAVSEAGAVGIGQLMPKTAAGRGVKDSKDPYKNIDASLAELKSLQKKYNNDTEKMAAAYNWGQGNLDKHLRKNEGEINPQGLPKETRNYVKKITALIPLSAAQAEEMPSPAPQAPPAQPDADRSIGGQFSRIRQGIAGIGRKANEIIAPESSDYAPGTRNFFERAADQLGVGEETQRNFSNTLNALPGVNVLRAPAAVGKLSAAAQAAREAEIAAAAEKAAAAQAKVANLRLPSSKPAQGIEQLARSPAAPPVAPRTTFPLSPESMAMNEKMAATRQAQALRNLEADRAAAQAATKGVTEATDAAKTAESIEMAKAASKANAMNRVTQPAQKALDAARAVQAERVSGGNPAVSPNAAIDDRTPRNPENYRVAPAATVDDRTPRDPANYKPEQKQEIIAATKEIIPKTKENEGWSGDDWLQFGLALMAGQSQYAMQNIGAAGLGVIASKAEQKREQNKLDLYRAIHEEKPGEKTRSIDRLMKDDPKLSYADALAKYTELTGGSTKQDLADARAEQVIAQKYKTWLAGKEKIDASIVGLRGNSAKASPADKQAYLNALAELGPNPMGEQQKSAPPATVIPGAKIVGTR